LAIGTKANQIKENMIKRMVVLLFVAATLTMGVTACHTVHGAGEDISSAGNKIQEHTPP
jgi:predicted small secreted protein